MNVCLVVIIHALVEKAILRQPKFQILWWTFAQFAIMQNFVVISTIRSIIIMRLCPRRPPHVGYTGPSAIPLKSSIIGWRKRRHYEIWGGFFHKRNICQQPAKITAMGTSLSSSVHWQCSPVWTTHNCHNFAEAFPHQAGGNPPSTLFRGPERNVVN